MTPEAIAAQRKIAQAMMQRGGDYSPIQSPWQGVARVAEGLMGGLDARAADAAERRNATAEKELLASLMPGAAAPVPAAPATAPATATPPAAIPAGKEGFVSTMMPLAEAASAKTGVDPRIIVAQAALESGWGKSAPGNNYFGIKSHGQPGGTVMPTTEVVNGQPVRTTDSFRAYASPEESAAGYADFINKNPRYGALKSAQGLDAQVAALGQSGYATDPNYAAKIASIAKSLPAPAAATPTDPAAIPPNAQPAQGFAVPGQPSPAVTQVAQAAPSGPNPRLLAAMASPYVSEGTKKVLGIMLQSQLSNDAVTQVDLGNKIGIMDKRGNIQRYIDKGEPNKGPEFGVIGKDEYGNEQYGWRDPRTQTTTPVAKPQSATPAQPSTIPPAPPGVDPKVWREAQSKRATEEGMPADTKVTSALRNEIQGLPSYKNLAQAAPVYRAMNEAANRDNRAADLNLIYGFGKIMDPGSVVRESEMTMAEKINTLPQYLRATAESQLTGSGRLSPEVRAQILAEAHTRIQSYKGMFDQDAGMYRGIAKRGRMNEEDVIPNFGDFTPWTPPKAAVPAPAAGSQKTKTGVTWSVE